MEFVSGFNSFISGVFCISGAHRRHAGTSTYHIICVTTNPHMVADNREVPNPLLIKNIWLYWSDVGVGTHSRDEPGRSIYPGNERIETR